MLGILSAIVLLYVAFLGNGVAYDSGKIDYYEKLIKEAKGDSESYKLLNDSKIYKPIEGNDTIDFGNYDFILVGSGSTGSVVASRLSERCDWKVLLLEAGDYGNDLTSIPRMAYASTILSDYNWGYYSIPQTKACLGFLENRCPHPRGKGIGGTGILNAMIYIRGSRKDFDSWCGMGNPGWCYEDVLPYFLKSENFQPTDPEAPIDSKYHSTGGPLRVEHPMPRTAHTKLFFDANKEMGFNISDVNGERLEGVMPFQITTKFGRRQNGAIAFLVPVLKRKNLTVMTKSLVTKILINDHKEAYGVMFAHEGVQYSATSTKEVIVCGGAINSPQLLMLSGIGPQEHLEEKGILVVQNLSVGSSFSDHIQVYGLTFSSNLSEPIRTLREEIKEFLENGQGPLAEAAPTQAVGYYQTILEDIPDYPDMELSFQDSNTASYALDHYQKWRENIAESIASVNASSSFQIFVTPLHTKSLGTIRLRSSDPYEYPDIDSNILSDPEGADLRSVYEGIQLALNITQTDTFRKINAKFEMKPIQECSAYEFLTREYWYCASRYIANHNNHPVSTCKMGPNPERGDVVDAQLRVHGVRNLRVADASVVPLSTSSHVNAICYMIGEKLSDLIKSSYEINKM
ncbi:hypothetical protein JTB14_024550 [Gonioctena quinquepunctata]|nr:hypothetical protein JTB14_024550 [Gonioctena quinquepunctata]